jgi:uncharacterized NAD(P)/FAD-binding protein YdhS
MNDFVKPFPASEEVIAVIGGGFSGTMVAVNLARAGGGRPLRIVLFERAARFARGIAYATPSPQHLLNVPAALMSALVDEPGHFLAWLQARDPHAQAGTFAPRPVYGEYLEELLARAAAAGGTRIELVRDEIVELRPCPSQTALILHGSGGVRLRAERVVLALGNPRPEDVVACPEHLRESRKYIGNCWDEHILDGLGRDDRLVLLGAGLSAVDVIVAARGQGFQGPITVLSRHGLLPRRHRADAARPVPRLDAAAARTARGLLRQIRREAARCEREGGDWRLVIDALRPSIPGIWRSFSRAEKARFIRHLGSRWDVHRHRIAPEIDQILEDARREGQLTVIAGRIRALAGCSAGVELGFSRRGSTGIETLVADRVINCTGPSRTLRAGQSPLVDTLLAHGLARPDPLALGLEVTGTGALLAADGTASERIFALGPILKGQLWETTAVRELRVLAHDLARHLLSLSLPATAGVPPVTATNTALASERGRRGGRTASASPLEKSA